MLKKIISQQKCPELFDKQAISHTLLGDCSYHALGGHEY